MEGLGFIGLRDQGLFSCLVFALRNAECSQHRASHVDDHVL